MKSPEVLVVLSEGWRIEKVEDLAVEAGFQRTDIMSFSNPDDAGLWIESCSSIDIAVCDIHLGSVAAGGYGVIKRLRQKHPQCTIICYTTETSVAELAAARIHGANEEINAAWVDNIGRPLIRLKLEIFYRVFQAQHK